MTDKIDGLFGARTPCKPIGASNQRRPENGERRTSNNDELIEYKMSRTRWATVKINLNQNQKKKIWKESGNIIKIIQ